MTIARRLLLSLIIVVAVAVEAGCADCTYDPWVNETMEITSIDPTATGTGSGCNAVRSATYKSTADPSPTPDEHTILVANDCVGTTLKVGSTFDIAREEEKTGTCDPEITNIVDPAVKACVCD